MEPRAALMAQLSSRLRRVGKTKEWERFRRLMLLVVLCIWFVTVVFRLSITDTESFMRETMGPRPKFHTRKLAWDPDMHPKSFSRAHTGLPVSGDPVERWVKEAKTSSPNSISL